MRQKVEVTRDEFEQATADLLLRTQNTTELVLRQAGLTWTDIDKVLLVGGATRMPMVERILTQLTGKAPDRSISPDEAVAHGAALYADLLRQRQHQGGRGKSRFALTNVGSHSLGIIVTDEVLRVRRNEVLIPRNTPLPCSMTRMFKTLHANQTRVSIRVVEGESERPDACSAVGVCTIDKLPANLPQGTPVHVTYAYQENGQLDVTARLEGQAAVVSTCFLREDRLASDALPPGTAVPCESPSRPRGGSSSHAGPCTPRPCLRCPAVRAGCGHRGPVPGRGPGATG
jgi:molecular chaperone DnaK